MKKYAILALAVLMVAAFTLPASALENEFGGYWDARMQTRNNFDGTDAIDDHDQNVEARTRLYYTAKINDNLKLVNKFEMDATWGAANDNIVGEGHGDVGADGVNIEVKNTYADFNTGPVNWTVGTQPYNLFRGYYIADDASGIIARWKVLDNFVLAGSWLKVYEGGIGDENGDVDSYTLSAAFWLSENISIKPSINWAHSADLTGGVGATSASVALGALAPALEGLDNFTFGVDFDMTYDNWGLWVTAIGQSGSVDVIPTAAFPFDEIDTEGWLFGIGGNVMLGPVELYAEGAYASGNDPNNDPDESDAYSALYASHVWSELLSDGSLWNGTPAGQPGTADSIYDQVTNLIYFGGGVKFNVTDKLAINPSIWYAMLDEDNATGDDELGTEVDLVVSYELVEGLNMDLIGAYLFAGDAFSNTAADNDDDAYEYGIQLSLSF